METERGGGEFKGLAEIQNPVERFQIPRAKGLNHRGNITKWNRNNASIGQVMKDEDVKDDVRIFHL